jgi:hypothetical protein
MLKSNDLLQLRLSIGRRSVGRGENMLDPEDMCQNTEEFTGEVGTVVAQDNQRNSVVAYLWYSEPGRGKGVRL